MPRRGFSLPDNSPETGIDLRPVGLVQGDLAANLCHDGGALPLAGGPFAFTACEMFVAGTEGVAIYFAALGDFTGWAEQQDPATARVISAKLDLLSRPRPDFAGMALVRPRLMGIVNVTPDSFSDGGDFFDSDTAISHGRELVAAGADLLDIGGESTRPGSEPTSPDAELARVLPVIAGLAGCGVPLSIDTRRGMVMDAALTRGVSVVNDITALGDDPDAPGIVARHGGSVILMHMLGRPRDMQAEPRYGHAPYEIMQFFKDRVAVCEQAGVPRDRIAVDPGIGFGKNDDHNLKILAEAAIFHGLGCAVVIGASRKSFIGRVADVDDAKSRLAGSLAAAALAAGQGAQILRVHDVAETRQALSILDGAFIGR
ncbi:MAG: dihydropteroate synthase [Rhodospirillales bacterium]|nr:dihydropteroate synthase [Rhodospirillales bacterium]